ISICYLSLHDALPISILRTISGLVKASGGSVEYEGKNLEKYSPKKIVEAGISQVPEGRHVFKGLSVKENLELGAFLRKDKDQIRSEEHTSELQSRFDL